MKISSLLTIIHAAHQTYLVQSPWEERGGIIICAPPGQLKTTLVNSLDMYPEALCLSDINVRSMKSIRDQVLGSRYKTIAFGELEKLYARNPATAANIEAHLKQFVEEGLRHFSYEDQSVAIMPARAFVLGGITPGMYGKMFTAWNESGFSRRFLTINYAMKDERAILRSVHKWKKIVISLPMEWNGKSFVAYNLNQAESQFIMSMMKDQPNSTPAVLLKRIACILKVKFPKQWRQIMEDFSPSLGRNGALLEL